MRQHHPLENPSLAPYGFVFPNRQERLRWHPQPYSGSVNLERIIGRLWDRHNRSKAEKSLPVQTIIHDILPGQATANRIEKADFLHEGLPYLTRDILVLSSAMQWFGTNVGGCFLEADISSKPGFHPEREFLMKCEREMELNHFDLPPFFVHICTERCRSQPLSFMGQRCYYDDQASARDRAVVDGLMRWLSRPAGRSFIAEYQRRKKNAFEAARSPEEKALREKFRVKRFA